MRKIVLVFLTITMLVCCTLALIACSQNKPADKPVNSPNSNVTGSENLGENSGTGEHTHTLQDHEKKDPTCTEVGWQAYQTCSGCDYTTKVEIPAKGHTPATPVEENKVDATCTAEGSYDEVIYCSVCTAEISRTKQTIAKGHNFVNKVCTKCQLAEDSVLEYVEDNRGYQVKGLKSSFNSNTKFNLNIPSEYNGKPVASIGSSAFENCTNLTGITIPDSVVRLGISAFEGCSGLTNITIPNSVLYFDSRLFYGCTSLTSVTIPNGVDTILRYTFYNCISLKNITIPDSVTSIGEYAFYGCSSLTNITIPDKVTSIAESAFYNCRGLISVTIGSGVTYIGNDVFHNCSNLTSATFVNTSGWWVADSNTATSGTTIASAKLSDPATAAQYLTSTYFNYYWHRKG